MKIEKLIKKYNKLDGRIVTRKELANFSIELFDELPSENEKIILIWKRVNNLLYRYPNASEFEISIELPIKISTGLKCKKNYNASDKKGAKDKKETVLKKRKEINSLKAKRNKLKKSSPKRRNLQQKIDSLENNIIKDKTGISIDIVGLGLPLLNSEIENDLGKDETYGLGKAVSNDDIYKMVTDKIIDAIETHGDLTWYNGRNNKKGKDAFVSLPLPINYNLKKHYRGINSFLLSMYPKFLGFKTRLGKKVKKVQLIPITDNRLIWLTFKQIEENRGKLKKNSVAQTAIYYNFIYKHENKLISEEKYNGLVKKYRCFNRLKKQNEYCNKLIKIPFLRYYNVFNERDIEGIDFEKRRQLIEKKAAKFDSTIEKIEAAEAIIKAMPKAPQLIERSLRKTQSPHYAPLTDKVVMPLRQQFDNIERWYGTAFHELTHSTGHASRLARKGITNFDGFGSESYAFEELVAELGAAFLNAESGILLKTVKNNAAYIKGWKNKVKAILQKDNKAIFIASAQAQRAADFILNRDIKGIPSYLKNIKKKNERKNVVKNKTTKKNKKTVAKNALKGTRRNGITGLSGDFKPVTNLVSKIPYTKASMIPEKVKGLFTLPGDIGKFLQNLQAYMALMLIKGPKHTSKSQLAMQIANAFGEMNKPVAYLDIEQGGISSKDTIDSINRNTSKKGRENVYIIGHIDNPIEEIEEIAKKFDVIVADSVTDLKLTADQLNYLRKKYPNKFWIFISQVKENGAMYGGGKMAHNPTIIIEIKPNVDYKQRIATLEKNRGNDISKKYNIFEKKIIQEKQEIESIIIEI